MSDAVKKNPIKFSLGELVYYRDEDRIFTVGVVVDIRSRMMNTARTVHEVDVLWKGELKTSYVISSLKKDIIPPGMPSLKDIYKLDNFETQT